MIQAKSIEITVDADGACTVDAVGFHGRGCAEKVSRIVGEIGGKVTKTVIKPEFHHVQGQGQQVKQGH